MESIAIKYYLKALEAYPWQPSDVLENLGFALSYHNGHAASHCLMAMLQMYFLKDLKKAEEHFNLSLASDLDYPETYEHFSLLFIWLHKYEAATKLINFGLTRPGIDKSMLLSRSALICEYEGNYQRATWYLYQAIKCCLDVELRTKLEKEQQRIKNMARKMSKAKQKFRKKYLH